MRTDKSVMVDGPGISKDPLKAPAAVNPLNPTQLMLAVSASQPTHPVATTINRAAFLQTFDLATAQHISRQALARNNTTVVNIGGTGEKIGEPDITHMKVSHDGQWLATIDEWCAPVKDVEYLGTKYHVDGEQESRREVFLKFWFWNTEGNEWQLVTRVDAPHDRNCVNGSGAGQVLAFAADPTDLGFASLGEDGGVCLWKPKTRRRNGVQVRDRNANGLVTWSSVHVIHLPNHQDRRSNCHLKAAIAYSADGSLLAACLQSSSADESGVVHFIDTASGEIRQSRPGLYAGSLVDMGIIDRYLIIVSDQLIVWDMVDDELHVGLSLRSHGLLPQKRAIETHLAVNQQHHTFAIALSILGDEEKRKQRGQARQNLQCQIAVFDPSLPTPLYTTTLPHKVTALLAATSSKGYILLDSVAEARILSPNTLSFVPDVAADAGNTTTPPALGLSGIYGPDQTTSAALDRDSGEYSVDETDAVTPSFTSIEAQPKVYDDDAPVVSQDQLAGVFDSSSAFAMPPVEQLFERVVGLFARKPRTA